ncbi:MAG: hypothetical protein L3J06_07445 [Cyclobacteriaceae bacterium]|nr:hypothetical protein [Cyclobacteriaceae bacterium]
MNCQSPACRTGMASQLPNFFIDKLLASRPPASGTAFLLAHFHGVFGLFQSGLDGISRKLFLQLSQFFAPNFRDKQNAKFLPDGHGISTFKLICTDNLLAFRHFLISYLSNRVWTSTTSLAITFLAKNSICCSKFIDFWNLTR